MSRRRGRVSRSAPVSPTELPSRTPSFVCAYAVDLTTGDSRSAEQWARALWEGAPRPQRWFMSAGWRGVLRLRLATRNSTEHILGWPIAERRPDITVCRARSPFLTAYNAFAVSDGQLVWSTYVFYDRPIARLLWPPASLVHRPMVKLSMARAQRTTIAPDAP